MSKRGPKRKAGARYPSGELKLAAPPPAQIKRMVAMAARGAADVFLATQLGWLRLEGTITDMQAAAGVRFAKLVGQHDAVLGLPHRTAPSPSYELGFAGVRAWSSPQTDAERVETLRRRYDAAVACLQENGPRVEKVVRAVCIEDRVPDWSDRPLLALGLDALARHFGLARGAFERRGQPHKTGHRTKVTK